eukprot:5464913-Amphidinium_carterae.2
MDIVVVAQYLQVTNSSSCVLVHGIGNKIGKVPGPQRWQTPLCDWTLQLLHELLHNLNLPLWLVIRMRLERSAPQLYLTTLSRCQHHHEE